MKSDVQSAVQSIGFSPILPSNEEDVSQPLHEQLREEFLESLEYREFQTWDSEERRVQGGTPLRSVVDIHYRKALIAFSNRKRREFGLPEVEDQKNDLAAG
ncbi:MAG: hypothetical protein IPJ67_04815 [Candidatus Moraniibacteriota bacterium]|nr:MAG: hypothetical protein IPJ67_04815 [Candidatus Moranbacteria bacterium]